MNKKNKYYASFGLIFCMVGASVSDDATRVETRLEQAHTTDETASLKKTTLSSSIKNIALSVRNKQLNSALEGNPRTITIQNVGNDLAKGLTIQYSTWPKGASATTTCNRELPQSSTCTISITPGSNASSNCNTGTIATPSVITVSAKNAPAIKINVVILSYGCIYQGGYVFSINDKYAEYPENTSVGGKIISTSDLTYNIGWDSSIACITEPYNNCTVTDATNTHNGNYYFPGKDRIDPKGNTYRIINQLQLDPINYAAGVCRQNMMGYSDWYLPAICEWGYYTPNSLINPGCGDISDPSMQNILSNLVDNGNIGNLWGMYWSSTEDIYTPNMYAWFQYLVGGGGSFQSAASKAGLMNVRCARAMSP